MGKPSFSVEKRKKLFHVSFAFAFHWASVPMSRYRARIFKRTFHLDLLSLSTNFVNCVKNTLKQVVVTWLERGDCTKRNANTFYSMIQSTNSHVRRLLTERASYEEELQRAKELMKGRMQGLLIQCTFLQQRLCFFLSFSFFNVKRARVSVSSMGVVRKRKNMVYTLKR